MIAYDLRCSAGDHRFEGWFASSVEYDRQKNAGLINCPICGSNAVSKDVMAPHVGRKGNQIDSRLVQKTTDAVSSVPLSNQREIPEELQAAITEIAKLQNKLLEKSEWVGDKFADEARSIHYGESDARVIHGEATLDQARELYDEGVSIAPLPLPFVPPEAKN